MLWHALAEAASLNRTELLLLVVRLEEAHCYSKPLLERAMGALDSKITTQTTPKGVSSYPFRRVAGASREATPRAHAILLLSSSQTQSHDVPAPSASGHLLLSGPPTLTQV